MIFNMVGKGGGGSLLISDTTDTAGGIIRTITATKTVKLQTKTINPTSSTQTVNPDTGYDGFSQVTVTAGGGSEPTIQSLSITPSESEQTFNSSSVDGYKPVIVDAIPITSSVDGNISTTFFTEGGRKYESIATMTPYENGYFSLTSGTSLTIATEVGNAIASGTTIVPTESSQTIGGANYMMEGAVTVSAISSTYVGSGIARKSSTDLTASGATVTVPAGYYSSQATKSVTTMTLPTSASSSATSGYTSKATIGRSTSAQYINIPPGYNSAGAYYVISAVANGSASAPSTISGTSATVSTGTNTLTLTKTVSVTPSVSAGYISSGTATNSSVSLTASVTTKAAATITPGTTNQTIASGTYLTGTQTISGDADLVASNIVNGVQIFGVTGNVVLQNYYTGSSAPSSSTGSNGDLYLQT